MTKNEILEGNKLIAKFIDLTPHNMFPDELQAPGEFSWMAVRVNTRAHYAKEDDEFISFENLFEFHSSWDWLMLVVEKIESLKHPVYISSNNCQIYEKTSWGENNGWHIDSYGKNKLEATYLAVVEFIKWHNKLIINK